MALPNSSITEIVATTLAHRSKKLADQVAGANALLAALKKKGKISLISGGRAIWEEFMYAENPNVGWYSGYDTLPTQAGDIISAAAFDWKQAACPVVWSGREEMMNNGPEQVIDLIETRIQNAESTLENLVAQGIYSDGTAAGGKQIDGLLAAVPVTPTTGTYGGINRATTGNEFWRSKATDTNAAPSASTIQGILNTMWISLQRGKDGPDLIVSDGNPFNAYLSSLQALQRFTQASVGDLGFPTVKYMGADWLFDGGINSYATADTVWMLNTKYLHFRVHKDRNFVPLNPARTAVNQDAAVKIIAWMGNLTSSGPQFQGQILFS